MRAAAVFTEAARKRNFNASRSRGQHGPLLLRVAKAVLVSAHGKYEPFHRACFYAGSNASGGVIGT